MSDPIAEFERDCKAASVAPADVLVRAGLHRCTWFRWKAKSSLPNLRSLNKARDALKAMTAPKRKIAA